MTPTRLLVAAAIGLAALGGCGTESATVAMVPSSLSGLTDDIEAATGTDVDWIIAGSSRLVRQLADGASADLLITADAETMADAVELGIVVGEPVRIAGNALVVALAPGNPAGITTVDDLEEPELLLGVCASEVPCGRLAAEVQAELGFVVAVDTEEPNVRALALKISRGELDAGLVYATDAIDLGLETLDSTLLADHETEYLAASLSSGAEPFVSFLRSEAGRALLSAAGFRVP